MPLANMSATEKHPLSPYDPVTLDKRTVATSQLEKAIELWESYADLASIHTLAAAASVVFDALGKKVGAPSVIREYLRGAPKAEYDRFTKAENFFKHAARDVDAVIDYDPMQAEILILDSIFTYESVEGDLSDSMLFFVLYFSLWHPGYFDMDYLWQPSSLPQSFKLESLRKLNRTQFFAKFRDEVPRGGPDSGSHLP
jgi:hypothetical protein